MEKYRPRRVEEMVGNEEARLAFVSWLKGWKEGRKAALLLGPPGTGKTTLVHLAAGERGDNLVELNASDSRTKEKLGRKVGEAMSSTNLLGSRTLIFLDEVDGLSGRSDYGAVEFIKESVKASKNPIVMAANNPDADQIRKLAQVCLAIRFKPPPPREVELYIRRVAEAEGLSVGDEAVRGLVSRAKGDMRHAINSLQSMSDGGRGGGEKDVSLSASESLNTFFEARSAAEALSALRACRLPPDEKVRGLFACVVGSTRLTGRERAAAMEALSRADVLLGRIRRGRNWRILRYLDGMLANELWVVLRGQGVRYSEGSLPWNLLLRVWNDSRKAKEIAKRYAAATRTSAKSAIVSDVPYLLAMCSSKKVRQQVVSSLDLDETFEKYIEKEAKAVSR